MLLLLCGKRVCALPGGVPIAGTPLFAFVYNFPARAEPFDRLARSFWLSARRSRRPQAAPPC